MRAVEAVQAARLSLCKAELYWAENDRLQEADVGKRIANIRNETEKWRARTVDEILRDFADA